MSGKQLGKYSRTLKITTEQILRGDLPLLKEIEITYGIVFELYQFWKKRKLTPAFFVEWMRCIHPKKKLIRKDIIQKVRAVKKRRDQLKQEHRKHEMRILEKALFRIKPSSSAEESEEKYKLTLPCEHKKCSKKITFTQNQKVKPIVLCRLHKRNKTKKKKKGSIDKGFGTGLTAESLKQMIAKSRSFTGHSTDDNSENSSSTVIICTFSCVVCDISMENMKGHKVLSTVAEDGPSDGNTILRRLEKVLERSLAEFSDGWLCSMCHSTLLQIEEYHRLMTLFKQKFEKTARAKQPSQTLPSSTAARPDDLVPCPMVVGTLSELPCKFADNARSEVNTSEVMTISDQSNVETKPSLSSSSNHLSTCGSSIGIGPIGGSLSYDQSYTSEIGQDPGFLHTKLELTNPDDASFNIPQNNPVHIIPDPYCEGFGTFSTENKQCIEIQPIEIKPQTFENEGFGHVSMNSLCPPVVTTCPGHDLDADKSQVIVL